MCEDIPIVLCGTNCDSRDRRMKPKHIRCHYKKNIQYYEFSTKMDYALRAPFLHIIRKLASDDTITFVSPEIPPTLAHACQMTIYNNLSTSLTSTTTNPTILDALEYSVHYNDNKVLEDCLSFIRNNLPQWYALLKHDNSTGQKFESRFNELCKQHEHLKATSEIFWHMHNNQMKEESDDDEL